MPSAFFLKKMRDSIFVGVAQAMTVQERLWVGGAIVYNAQSELEGRLYPTMRKASAFLHSEDYYGPVGLDVPQDKTGVQWAVELNVREGGSYILCSPTKQSLDRRLGYASLLLMTNVKINRHAFVE